MAGEVTASFDSAAGSARLKRALHRSQGRARLGALGLVLPLLIFIVFSFVLPIGTVLWNAIYDPDIRTLLPQATHELKSWSGEGLPDEAVYAAFAADMTAAQKAGSVALIGKRLNYELPGMRSKVIATGRKITTFEGPPWREGIIALDPVWGETQTWAIIKRTSHSVTPYYLLAMLDLYQTPEGAIASVPPERATYRAILWRTLGISSLVTLCTLLLGFPVAFLLASLPQRTASLLMIFVLLPFWTSLLVRTTAWMVLLQDHGPVNQALEFLGLTSAPLPLLHSRFGTLIAMTHIQLPFTLLPIYAVMKSIPPNLMRAGKSLGAHPFYAFVRIYLPLTWPGVAAGCLLTFILCLGYYITPALVGGPGDQMVSGVIEVAINRENNWGKASAYGALLLVAVLILCGLYRVLTGSRGLKVGQAP